MSKQRVLVSVGDVAVNPYYFERICTELYSIEELCYVLHENAFMIDKDIMTKELVDWIETECHLSDLAHDLYVLVNQSAQVSTFVGTILDYVGYYDREETEKTENILRMNVSMNVFEKWKAKADFLYENGHFLLALKEYDHVLGSISDEEFELKSRIYNNMGVTYMAILLYASAEDCFMKAYEIDNNETAYKHYLTAKRLELTDEAYVKLIAENDDAYKTSLTVESELLKAEEDFEASGYAELLKQEFAKKKEPGNRDYYDYIDKISEKIKSDYRESLLEGDGV